MIHTISYITEGFVYKNKVFGFRNKAYGLKYKGNNQI